jgi:hypothetical protein
VLTGKALQEHEEILKAVQQKKAAIVVRRAELSASLDWLEKARAGGQELAVQLKAAAWAAGGYDRLPKDAREKTDLVQAYAASLKGELDELQAIASALEEISAKELAVDREQRIFTLTEKKIQEDIADLTKRQQNLLERQREIQIAGIRRDYEVSVLAAPHVKSGP